MPVTELSGSPRSVVQVSMWKFACVALTLTQKLHASITRRIFKSSVIGPK